MAYVELNNISFRYQNSKEKIIEGLNMKVEKGEIIGICGRSGIGKSTILRLIAGLESPEDGEIKIGDNVLVNEKTFLLPENRHIGMVFQDYALFPHLTVEKNIAFGLDNLSRAKKKQRVKEMVELVHLQGLEKRYPYELSGGQQQRVALARSLARKPSVLLMDEPFSNLDYSLKETIRKELKEILKKEDMTCIFVSHDEEDVQVVCDRCFSMNDTCALLLDIDEILGKKI